MKDANVWLTGVFQEFRHLHTTRGLGLVLCRIISCSRIIAATILLSLQLLLLNLAFGPLDGSGLRGDASFELDVELEIIVLVIHFELLIIVKYYKLIYTLYLHCSAVDVSCATIHAV